MKPFICSSHFVVLVLSIAIAAEMASVEAGDDCYHLSAKFKGWCLYPDHCADVCSTESDNNLGGTCRGFPSRCYCRALFCPQGPKAAPSTIAAARSPPTIG
ncbi:defensin-like protein P322 [Zea mays]|uniref:Knottins-like domain-containing protein n=1 Tax=Zea mays TaxID=4577 RepID=A0A1D6K7Q8_MAIZE|nr:defensin-like protein P322 [Zea mays]ONL99584.1 hypothetical protein ZEAMMB73_Zm00001d029773 [Zea mays]|eukprot:XP_008658034.1 defensin-like protein P322 [Zea mays]